MKSSRRPGNFNALVLVIALAFCSLALPCRASPHGRGWDVKAGISLEGGAGHVNRFAPQAQKIH